MTDEQHQGRMAGTRWDPAQYARFSDHRLRPALELMSRISLEAPSIIYDLGCGTGQITRMMSQQWPKAQVFGVDNSREMLDRAAAEADDVQWIEADIREWTPDGAPDLIFSNAALQWVEGHDGLFPRLAGFVRRGGCLAVQMPMSWGLASHRLMREVLANGGLDGGPIGRDALRDSVARNWVAGPETYYDLLAGDGRTLDIWTTEYLQVLVGKDPVVEWVKGTGLRPILHDLDDDSREQFIAEYTRRVALAYPPRADGDTVYPFRRLFMVAGL